MGQQPRDTDSLAAGLTAHLVTLSSSLAQQRTAHGHAQAGLKLAVDELRKDRDTWKARSSIWEGRYRAETRARELAEQQLAAKLAGTTTLTSWLNASAFRAPPSLPPPPHNKAVDTDLVSTLSSNLRTLTSTFNSHLLYRDAEVAALSSELNATRQQLREAYEAVAPLVDAAPGAVELDEHQPQRGSRLEKQLEEEVKALERTVQVLESQSQSHTEMAPPPPPSQTEEQQQLARAEARLAHLLADRSRLVSLLSESDTENRTLVARLQATEDQALSVAQRVGKKVDKCKGELKAAREGEKQWKEKWEEERRKRRKERDRLVKMVRELGGQVDDPGTGVISSTSSTGD